MSYGQHFGPIKSWSERLLEFAISVVVAALLLNWAWQLLRPLVPVMAVVAGIVVVTIAMVRHFRNW